MKKNRKDPCMHEYTMTCVENRVVTWYHTITKIKFGEYMMNQVLLIQTNIVSNVRVCFMRERVTNLYLYIKNFFGV